jgi:hypothetical protein
MRTFLPLKVVSGLLALLAAGCSGGGADAASLREPCSNGANFCLIRCDLGCSQTGCSITEIAENQRLKFTFSSRLRVDSVTPASVSIRTATGVAPEGELLVTGSEITFVPRVRTVNGVSSFGFARNESYIITLAGGPTAPFGVRSTSGATLASEFSCTVVASLGIADEDQQPPRATLIAPVDLNNAPLDPTIVIRFSELIDTTPLRGTLTSASPIRFTLRRAISVGGVLQCDRDAQGTVLEGIPRLSTDRVGATDVTVVTFRPTVQLPGESCVEVAVTADLRDLSGRQGEPALFRFFTVPGVSVPISFVENFSTPAGLAPEVSSGLWSNGARPGLIGGDGRHGSFSLSLATPISASEYNIDTTLVTIPPSNSLNGQEYLVTDGKFYFTDFRVPPGITINFIGPVPPQIFVRGQVNVEGSLRLNAAPMAVFNARGVTTAPAPFVPGQPGGLPGAGGGRGGQGGNECQGTGPVGCNGSNGEDVRLLAGHAYVTGAVGTGGRGSTMNPPTGIAAPNAPLISGAYRSFFAAGGGGGGFSLAGTTSTVSPLLGLQIGASPTPSVLFNLFPFPPVSPPPNYSSLNHFVVGGSGGGGGASHAFGTLNSVGADIYVAGAGGSGGGGALALRSGGDMVIAAAATLQARGGAGVLFRGNDGVTTTNVNWGVASPGGGGSGGSFLLQSGANLNMLGTINTSGGNGSSTGQVFLSFINAVSQAGAGSPGFYRLEAGGTLNFGSSGVNVPAYNAAQNAGSLLDRDDFTGATSIWRSTNVIFPPQWLGYELDVDTDGDGTIDITYTDSGAPGTQIANDPIAGPVMIQFQGAQMAQSSTEPLPGTLGPWRFGIGAGAVPGIGLDSAIGFRFMLTFNRGLFPNCIVRALRVNART